MSRRNPVEYASHSHAHDEYLAQSGSQERSLGQPILTVDSRESRNITPHHATSQDTDPWTTSSPGSILRGAPIAELQVAGLASRQGATWHPPAAILSLNFEKNCVVVRAKTQNERQTICFSAWPGGGALTELPTDIAYEGNRAFWGFPVRERPELSDGNRYESLKEILEAASRGHSTISQQDAIILFSHFLTFALGHVKRTLFIDRSECHYSFILPSYWCELENKAFNDVIEKVVRPSESSSVLREVEAGTFFFARRYPNESGILIMTDYRMSHTALNNLLGSSSPIVWFWCGCPSL